MTWLSQPLCLGLTRLSGIVLFGSMGFLGCAAIAGLIASIVTYSQGEEKRKVIVSFSSRIYFQTITLTRSGRFWVW